MLTAWPDGKGAEFVLLFHTLKETRMNKSLKLLLSLSLVGAAATAAAEAPTVVRQQGPSVNVTRNVSVGPQATTIYTQPAQGANGPVQGSQRGSSANTSYGVGVTISHDIGGGGKK